MCIRDREKGYIRIESRKAAKVIYQVNDERINENAALYFVSRREGMVDFCHSGRLLIEPIWEYAQGSLDQETWGRLKQKLAQAANVDPVSYTHLQGYSYMTGTSMAAPMVSAAAALVYSYGENISGP